MLMEKNYEREEILENCKEKSHYVKRSNRKTNN